jgi:hypothetical protein
MVSGENADFTDMIENWCSSLFTRSVAISISARAT